MAAAIAIDALLHQQCVWRGQLMALPPSLQPTGHAELDATLPTGGWPEAARSELLIPVDGVSELQLLWSALARLSQKGKRILLVASPYVRGPSLDPNGQSMLNWTARLFTSFGLLQPNG